MKFSTTSLLAVLVGLAAANPFPVGGASTLERRADLPAAEAALKEVRDGLVKWQDGIDAKTAQSKDRAAQQIAAVDKALAALK